MCVCAPWNVFVCNACVCWLMWISQLPVSPLSTHSINLQRALFLMQWRMFSPLDTYLYSQVHTNQSVILDRMLLSSLRVGRKHTFNASYNADIGNDERRVSAGTGVV
jgi:hypothetical protein